MSTSAPLPSVPPSSQGAARTHGCCGSTARPGPIAADSATGDTRASKQVIRPGALSRLRQNQGLLQQALAERLAISQACIAGMEQKPDMLLSTLRRYVQALGGELELIARFPDVSYHLGDKPR